MDNKTLISIFCVITVVFVVFFSVRTYLNSGYHIDETFSNRTVDNKQSPKQIEGECLDGTKILSADILRETNSSMLVYVTYCNESVGDKAVLSIKANEHTTEKWASTPGGTVAGRGDGYVRLLVSDLQSDVTVSEYSVQIYENNSGKIISEFPFYYEKSWCTGNSCEE